MNDCEFTIEELEFRNSPRAFARCFVRIGPVRLAVSVYRDGMAEITPILAVTDEALAQRIVSAARKRVLQELTRVFDEMDAEERRDLEEPLAIAHEKAER